jgi:hypothetical protein
VSLLCPAVQVVTQLCAVALDPLLAIGPHELGIVRWAMSGFAEGVEDVALETKLVDEGSAVLVSCVKQRVGGFSQITNAAYSQSLQLIPSSQCTNNSEVSLLVHITALFRNHYTRNGSHCQQKGDITLLQKIVSWDIMLLNDRQINALDN